ncbi:hydrogenase maturation protease [Anaeromyxobacter diazotrophicus]|uniref:Peptidase M52 n=1 Tax=Anaeromyxobacter diazotrophicus TaxID=2590199 RepID=A0A7I9VGY6_9BACT|nr:hydrogenase maturation protease [Anaeromyxobacter diazotrophicus]GEJ55297.1 peptidase M52 [Anaeromyxobacter diazotrophicus]
MSRIAIIGLGNVLMGDDGFGPYVAQLLEGWYDWPDDVQVTEIGTQGVDLTPFVRGAEALVVVSSVHRKAPPGTLHRVSHAEVMDRELPNREPALRNSPYEPALRNLVLTLEFTGGAPRQVAVVGAEPESVELNGGLSDRVRPALEPAVAAVLEVLATHGVRPRPRQPRPEVLPWWEIRQGA